MENQDDFLETRVSYGVILRVNLESVREIKEFLANFEDAQVVYQTVDGGKLRIEKEEGSK